MDRFCDGSIFGIVALIDGGFIVRGRGWCRNDGADVELGVITVDGVALHVIGVWICFLESVDLVLV